jgi:hypothetical protein
MPRDTILLKRFHRYPIRRVQWKQAAGKWQGSPSIVRGAEAPTDRLLAPFFLPSMKRKGRAINAIEAVFRVTAPEVYVDRLLP